MVWRGTQAGNSKCVCPKKAGLCRVSSSFLCWICFFWFGILLWIADFEGTRFLLLIKVVNGKCQPNCAKKAT